MTAATRLTSAGEFEAVSSATRFFSDMSKYLAYAEPSVDTTKILRIPFPRLELETQRWSKDREGFLQTQLVLLG
jgi:hypothetical protein